MTQPQSDLSRELEHMAAQDNIDTGPALRVLLTATAQLIRTANSLEHVMKSFELHKHDDDYVKKTDHDALKDELERWKNIAKGIAIGGLILGGGIGAVLTKVITGIVGP